MNEMEHHLVDKTLEAIHSVEKEVIGLQGEIKSLREHGDDQHNAMQSKLDQNIKTTEKRLDDHSDELDDHRERLATLEEWKKQFDEAIRNRLITWQSISAIICVLIAYTLSKFF